MGLAPPLFAAGRPASAVLPPLSDGGWGLGEPAVGAAPIEARLGIPAERIAEQAALEVRREAGVPSPWAYRRPPAPRLPRGEILQPDHIDGLAGKLLWSMSAQVAGRGERGLLELPEVVRSVERGRPDAFGLEAMPREMLGAFEFSDVRAPRILFSERLKRLHAQGVPMELLASVAVHELDHADAHFEGDARGELDIEKRAFQREAAYLRTIGPAKIRALLESAASAGGEEAAEFYANSALILEADRQGVLEDYIRAAYGHAR